MQKSTITSRIIVLLCYLLIGNIATYAQVLHWGLDSLKKPTCQNSSNGALYFHIHTDMGAPNLFIKKKNTTSKIQNPPYQFQLLLPDTYRVWVYIPANQHYSDTLLIVLTDTNYLKTSYQVLQWPVCMKDSTFAFRVQTHKGNPPFQYKLSSSSLTQSNDTFHHLLFSRNLVQTIDSKGCESWLVIPDSIFKHLSVQTEYLVPVSCTGRSDGLLHMKAYDGHGKYSITWKEFPNDTLFYKTNLGFGWYHYTVKDSLDCNLTDSVFMPIRYINNKIQFCNATQLPGEKHVTLTWLTNDLVAPEKILLYRSRYLNGSEDLVATLSPYHTSEYTDTSVLAENGPWYYGLKVQDSCGNFSGFSSTTRAGLGHASKVSDGILLNWSPYIGRAGTTQIILRETDNVSFNIGQVSPLINTFTDKLPFEPGKEITYTILWKFTASCQDSLKVPYSFSNSFSFKIPSGVTNIPHQPFRVYPIPATDKIQLEGPAYANTLAYVVYNLSGKTLLNGTLNNQNTLNIHELLPGIYLLQLSDNMGAIHYLRFIKQ